MRFSALSSFASSGSETSFIPSNDYSGSLWSRVDDTKLAVCYSSTSCGLDVKALDAWAAIPMVPVKTTCQSLYDCVQQTKSLSAVQCFTRSTSSTWSETENSFRACLFDQGAVTQDTAGDAALGRTLTSGPPDFDNLLFTRERVKNMGMAVSQCSSNYECKAVVECILAANSIAGASDSTTRLKAVACLRYKTDNEAVASFFRAIKAQAASEGVTGANPAPR